MFVGVCTLLMWAGPVFNLTQKHLVILISLNWYEITAQLTLTPFVCRQVPVHASVLELVRTWLVCVLHCRCSAGAFWYEDNCKSQYWTKNMFPWWYLYLKVINLCSFHLRDSHTFGFETSLKTKQLLRLVFVHYHSFQWMLLPEIWQMWKMWPVRTDLLSWVLRWPSAWEPCALYWFSQ